jgi:hypothetical protein
MLNFIRYFIYFGKGIKTWISLIYDQDKNLWATIVEMEYVEDKKFC